MVNEEKSAREIIESPRFRQIVNWTALGLLTLLFVVPRVSPFDGLNSFLNDLNFFRRFSEWLIGKTEDLFRNYGYYVVFFGVLAENTMFLGLLVPGAIILILGGLAAENGSINLWLVLALGITATVIGDTISYFIGRSGWARFMQKGSMGKAIERVRAPVESNSVWIILGYHFAGYSRVVGPLAAGLFRIPYRRWAPLDYAGAALWVITFTIVGFAFGLAGVEFGDTKRMVQLLEIGIFVVFCVAVVFAFIRFNQHQGGSEGGDDDSSPRGKPATVIVPVDKAP
jgi:membrane protein DedA with SNARE-associated domain